MQSVHDPEKSRNVESFIPEVTMPGQRDPIFQGVSDITYMETAIESVKVTSEVSWVSLDYSHVEIVHATDADVHPEERVECLHRRSAYPARRTLNHQRPSENPSVESASATGPFAHVH